MIDMLCFFWLMTAMTFLFYSASHRLIPIRKAVKMGRRVNKLVRTPWIKELTTRGLQNLCSENGSASPTIKSIWVRCASFAKIIFSLQSETKRNEICFAFIVSHWSEKNFASILLRSENDGSFSLLFCFVFALFHFRFASDFYVSHRCETSEKSTFLCIEAKKISLPFRFISLRSEKWRRTLIWV